MFVMSGSGRSQMIRAKMSDGSRFEAVERARSTFEREAVAEAQAILAETEPDVRQEYTPYRPLWTPRGTTHGINNTLVGLALAESLAAFVQS